MSASAGGRASRRAGRGGRPRGPLETSSVRRAAFAVTGAAPAHRPGVRGAARGGGKGETPSPPPVPELSAYDRPWRSAGRHDHRGGPARNLGSVPRTVVTADASSPARRSPGDDSPDFADERSVVQTRFARRRWRSPCTSDRIWSSIADGERAPRPARPEPTRSTRGVLGHGWTVRTGGRPQAPRGDADVQQAYPPWNTDTAHQPPASDPRVDPRLARPARGRGRAATSATGVVRSTRWPNGLDAGWRSRWRPRAGSRSSRA
jgi:hypothetical protein